MIHRHPALLLFSALLGVCGAHAQPMGQEKPQELRQYYEELRRLSAAPPADEYVAVTVDGSFLFRKFNVWVKAAPAVPRADGTSRSFSVFLEDSVGNRLRTVPHQISLSVAPPARLKSEGVLRLQNGEVSGEVIYAAGQPSARLTIGILPRGAATETVIDLPAENGKSVQYLSLAGYDEPGAPAPAARQFARETSRTLLRDARQAARRGRKRPAQHMAISAGFLLLEAGMVDEALETFQMGAKEFDAALSAWGEIQILRAQGATQEASARVEDLLSKHAASVPAAFARERAGELWFVPHGAQFRPLHARRTQ